LTSSERKKMPSSSFFGRVGSLVTRSTQTMRQVPFLCSFAHCAAYKFTRPLRNNVLSTMFFRADKGKIFRPVIERVSVFMVNVYSFWSVCNDTVLIRPFVRLCNFYLHIGKAIASFVQARASYRSLNSNLFQDTATSSKNFRRKCFIGTFRATRGVVVRLSIFAFPSYNGSAAKGTGFGSKFFHVPSIYQVS